MQFNDKLSLFPFIHSFRKFLLSPSYVPGGTFLDVLGTAPRLCLHPTQTKIVEIAEDPPPPGPLVVQGPLMCPPYAQESNPTFLLGQLTRNSDLFHDCLFSFPPQESLVVMTLKLPWQLSQSSEVLFPGQLQVPWLSAFGEQFQMWERKDTLEAFPCTTSLSEHQV